LVVAVAVVNRPMAHQAVQVVAVHITTQLAVLELLVKVTLAEQV
jgi:hypothetical protein